MKKLNSLWYKLMAPQNQKALYIVLALVALAVAAGAPGAGSGIGSNGVGILDLLP
jgi:hypothetical protein